MSSTSNGRYPRSDCIKCSSRIRTASRSSSISRHPKSRQCRPPPLLELPLADEAVIQREATTLTPDDALARARAMVPDLKARAPIADSLRRCPDESVRELNDSGLMRVLQPRRVGGSELPWVALIDIGST